jgi:hypothetical protein
MVAHGAYLISITAYPDDKALTPHTYDYHTGQQGGPSTKEGKRRSPRWRHGKGDGRMGQRTRRQWGDKW